MMEKEESGERKTVKIRVPRVSGVKRLHPRRRSFWVLTTMLLLFTTIYFLASGGGQSGLSGSKAGEKTIDYINNNLVQAGTSASVVSTEDFTNYMYKVATEYQGNTINIYTTKDGNYLFTLMADISDFDESAEESDQQPTQTTQPSTPDVVKAERPVVELFIWGYCPYGVQAQGPLVEVASLLEDYADFKAVLYYDGHGAYETHQNKIQECIQEIEPDKYWDYADKFVDEIYPACGSERTVECDETESVSVMGSLEIDSDEILSCVDSQGEDLISDASSRASELGVTGSPTLVINGAKVDVARNAESFKTVICDAFNTAPGECSQQLSGDIESSTSARNC